MSFRSNEATGAPRGSRRDVLIGAAAMATAPLIASDPAAAQPTAGSAPASPANRSDRRRLGGLEVSAIGLGCYSLVVLIRIENGERVRTTSGVTYEDEYICRDGRWLIARRTSHFVRGRTPDCPRLDELNVVSDARPFDPFRSTERPWRNSLARRSSSCWRMVS
jgi:hypothetical protein